MSEMKLIMEGWRKYKIQEDNNYGPLYLFENDSIQETSFYERYNNLQESGEDLDIFLEEWTRSVDYMLENLDEKRKGKRYRKKTAPTSREAFPARASSPVSGPSPRDVGIMEADPIIKTSAQAFLMLQKGKRAVGTVLGAVGKLKGAIDKKKKENPKLAKVASYALTALVAGAVAVAATAVIQSGADSSEIVGYLTGLADQLIDIDSDAAQSLTDLAQDPMDAVKTKNLIAGNEQEMIEVATQLKGVDSDAVQQVASAAEGLADTIPDVVDTAVDDPGARTAATTAAPTGAPSKSDQAYGKFAQALVDVGNESGVKAASDKFVDLGVDPTQAIEALEDLSKDRRALASVGIDHEEKKMLIKVLRKARKFYAT